MSSLAMPVGTVNVAMMTAYTPNDFVASVIDEAVVADLDLPFYPRPMPKPSMADENWLDPALKKDMLKQLREWHVSFDTARAARLGMRAAHASARKYMGKRCWLPMVTIESGRMHYKPSLNPQSSKADRALLDFADGLPIATDAQVYQGELTVSELWPDGLTPAQADKIVADPLRYDDWMHGDGPLLRLRAAQWLSEFHGTGLGYVDHMVHYRDQTCSGPSHYVALLRDDELAPHVDLVHSDEPDLYNHVAARAVALAQSIDTETAQAVARHGITRDIAKMVVMPRGYGAKRRSVENAIIQHFYGSIERGLMTAPYDNMYRFCLCLAECLWMASEDVMRRPLALQRWLGEVATQAAREQVQLSWIAPSGFPVAIAEWRKSARRIRTHVGQTLWCPKVYDDTDQLDGNAMRQTVPPTFIHSFEAAFLARAVQYAQHLDDPITDVALIHDSIGVHCTALPDLLADDGPIKRAWVDQYTPDHLAAVADCFQEQLADDLPALPDYGTHQASEVSLSGRFFQN